MPDPTCQSCRFPVPAHSAVLRSTGLRRVLAWHVDCWRARAVIPSQRRPESEKVDR